MDCLVFHQRIAPGVIAGYTSSIDELRPTPVEAFFGDYVRAAMFDLQLYLQDGNKRRLNVVDVGAELS